MLNSPPHLERVWLAVRHHRSLSKGSQRSWRVRRRNSVGSSALFGFFKVTTPLEDVLLIVQHHTIYICTTTQRGSANIGNEQHCYGRGRLSSDNPWTTRVRRSTALVRSYISTIPARLFLAVLITSSVNTHLILWATEITIQLAAETRKRAARIPHQNLRPLWIIQCLPPIMLKVTLRPSQERISRPRLQTQPK